MVKQHWPTLTRLAAYLLLYAANLVYARSMTVVLLSLPLMVLVLGMALANRRQFIGIHDLVAFTTLVFFVLRPMQAMVDLGANGLGFAVAGTGIDSPVGARAFASWQVVDAFVGCGIFAVLALLATLVFGQQPMDKGDAGLSHWAIWALAGFSIVGFAGFVATSGGFGNLFLPRTLKENLESVPPWSTAFQAAQMVGMAMVWARARQHGGALVWLVALGLLGLQLLAANPFNTSRNALMAAYGPLALVLVRGLVRPRSFFLAALVFMMAVMPVLNKTTRGDEQGIETKAENPNPLTIPFVDTFDMVLANVAYTHQHGQTWGAKLAGDMLFIVPRAIWPAKPTLNGLDVGGQLLMDKTAGTDNLSMPLFADGYRDFGMAGYGLGSALFFGLIYLGAYRVRYLVAGAPLHRYFVLASVPIVLRGPFSSTVPLVFFQIVMLQVALWLFAQKPARSGA